MSERPAHHPSEPAQGPRRTGLVLSGGGARGAYEAGLVAGIVDVLNLGPDDPPPFQIYAGSSVGAINAAFLAAHAHRGDMGTEVLLNQWRSLELAQHLRIDLLGLFGFPRRWRTLRKRHQLDAEHIGSYYGRSLLDPKPLESLVRDAVPWAQLHENIRRGAVHSLLVTALHVSTGRTHMFHELGPGAYFRSSRDPRRFSRNATISADHVLASAAIPLLFPARRVGDSFFCDGGLRFNTPLSPAIRSGADRLVVIVLRRGADPKERDALEDYPDPFFLLGKILAALLLDPIDYDLEILNRFNDLIEVLEDTLDADEFRRFNEVVYRTRGARYRRVETLSFSPSENIGRLAAEHLLEKHDRARAGRIAEYLLQRTARVGKTFESDLVSFLLFDGHFAQLLIDLGRADALARADEVKKFFAPKA